MKQRFFVSFISKVTHILQFLDFLHRMFNVSVLLLDDVLLKCVVTEVVLLLLLRHISQDSVATHLRCGGIFSDSIITNGLLILTVKQV